MKTKKRLCALFMGIIVCACVLVQDAVVYAGEDLLAEEEQCAEENLRTEENLHAEEELRAEKELQVEFAYEQTLLASGNTMAAATAISTDTGYAGTISETNTVDWYRFTLKSSGKINLKATAQLKQIRYRIYDSDGVQLWDIDPYWNSTSETISTNEDIHLTKGTYYFVVERYSGYSEYMGSYSFSLNYTDAGESFTETGNGTDNSMKTANVIKVDQNYKGQLAKNDEKDFYQFTMASSGCISLTAMAEMEHIYYRIYDSDGAQLWSTTQYWNSTTETISTSEKVDLTKGTYYFVAERYYNDVKNMGNYSFRLNYVGAGESFEETGDGTDNTMNTANDVEVNKTYRGQIAVNDEKDFYRFTLAESQKVTLAFDAAIHWVYLHLYDSAGNQLWSLNPAWNSTTETISRSNEIVLSAGTYYFSVEREGSYTGNYSFRLGTHTHSYKNVVTKATTSKNGSIVRKCSCGSTSGTTVVYYPKTISLSASSYTYDGTAKKPTVKVKGSDGKTIAATNYTLTYDSGRKNVGTYAVKIKFKGNYSGTVTKTFTVKPKGTSVSKVSAKSKGFQVIWKKQATQTTGYQVQYATNSSFTNGVTKTISKNTSTSATYTKLKAKKKYYVRIRTYRTVSGKKYYSSWSAAKAVTTKK